MKKEVSPIAFIIIIVVLIAVIAFVYLKATGKTVKKPPPGVMPMPKAPVMPGGIVPPLILPSPQQALPGS